MKFVTMSVFFTILFLSTSVKAEEDLLPEFCMATFFVTTMYHEADLWKATYHLESEWVVFFQARLTSLLELGEISQSDLNEAALGCQDARIKEQEMSDGLNP